MKTLNPIALQYVAILRALRDRPKGGWPSAAGLAADFGQDKSNFAKKLKILEEAGLIGAAPLIGGPTAEGLSQLAAIDRAEGQGTDDRFPDQVGDIVFLQHRQILPDPDQARRDWDSAEAQDELDALRNDILENGLLQNLVVRAAAAETPRNPEHPDEALFILNGGERRWRAIGLAIAEDDWPDDRAIPCRLHVADDLGHRLAALAENIQRRNLNPIEKARAFEGLAESLTNQEIADRIGSTPEHVQQHRRFLKLDEADQQRMALPKDDPRHLSVRDARQKLTQLAAKADAWSPLKLPAEDRLVLAELTHALRRRSAYIGNQVPVGPEAREDPRAAALAEQNILTFGAQPSTYGEAIGHYHGGFCGWAISDACRSAWPNLCADDATARDQALADLQGEHGAALAEDATYATPWLNGPFALTAEGQALVDAAEASRAAHAKANAEREQEREAARARYAEARERHLAVLNAAAEAPPADMSAATIEAAAAVDHPLPWTLLDNGDVVDAGGQEISDLSIGYGGVDDEEMTLRQLVVVSVNSAAGLPTPPIKSAEEHYADPAEPETADDSNADADADDAEAT